MTQPMSLVSFLGERRTSENDWNLTGLTSGVDKGKYVVNDSDYDTFLELAWKHIFVGHRSSSLLEKHRDASPILIDLDFKYEAGGPLKREFTDDHIRKFISEYVAAMVFFARIEDLSTDLQFYHLQKPAAELDKGKNGTNHKDGCHIHCPSITTHPRFQFCIRGFLLNRGIIDTLFAPTGIINVAEDCFDVSVIQRNNWFIYGACKPDKAQYTITKVWTVPIAEIQESLAGGDPVDYEELVEIIYEIMTEDTIPPNNLATMKRLSIRRGHDVATPLAIRNTRLKEWETLGDTWGRGNAKIDKSEKYVKNTIDFTDASDEHLIVTTTTTKDADETVARSPMSNDDITLAYRLCKECINPERRAGDYRDWINLAMCLKNIASTDASFLVWVDVTRRVDPEHKKATYSETELRTKWGLVPKNDSGKKLTIASLIHWARDDNPTKYDSILSEYNTAWLIACAKDTHVNVASFIAKLYWYEFRCSPSSRKGNVEWFWYIKGAHAWKYMPQPMEIRKRISGLIRNEYVTAGKKVADQFVVAEEAQRDNLDKKRKLLYTIEQNLEKTSFKSNVLTECTEKFYDEEFIGKLNTNTSLLGVQNGVLDLRYMETPSSKPRVLFRDGLPDDNISFQAGRSPTDDPIPYVPYNPHSPVIALIMEFFRRIYPDPELMEFVLTLLASCLEGSNREQRFYVMTGGGSNGKSMIVEKLMKYTLGEYCTTLSTTVITRKKPDSGSANPDIIVVKNKRFIYMGEPDEGEKINTSIMKQYTGGDSIAARGLFAEQDQFSITGKMFLCCNDKPDVNKMDNGTWRRIRVIPHITKFVAAGTAEINHDANIYEKDDHLEIKLKSWRVEFLSLLVHYYETRYLEHGLEKEPACILVASSQYKSDNDMFMAFFNDIFKKEVGAGPVTLKEFKQVWKDWKRANGKMSDMKDAQLVERMREVCGGGSTDKIFYNVRMNEEEDMSGGLLRPL